MLAMPISLFIAILFGPSGIAAIIMLVFDILSLLQLIIFAEAGAEIAHKAARVKIVVIRIECPPSFVWPVCCCQYRYER
jgi:hypothetical protein